MKNILVTAAIVLAGLVLIYWFTRPPPLPLSPPPFAPPPLVSGGPNPYPLCEAGDELMPNTLSVTAFQRSEGPPFVHVVITHPAGAQRPDLTLTLQLVDEEVEAFVANPGDLGRQTFAIQPIDGRGRLTLSHGQDKVDSDCAMPEGHVLPVCKIVKLAGGPQALALRRALIEGEPIAYQYDQPARSGVFTLSRADLAAAGPAAKQAIDTLRRQAPNKCVPSPRERL